MGVKGISFDLDDTLWDCRSVLLGARDAFFDYLRTNFPRMLEVRSERGFGRLMVELASTRPECQDFTLCRKLATEMIAKEAGYDPQLVVDPAFEVFIAARQRVVLYEGVGPMLQRLKARGYVLGCISNGNADVTQIPELRDLFTFAVNVSTCGHPKPAPEPFHQALKLAGIKADDCVHVGDNYVADVIGAKDIGMRTVWVNPTGQSDTTLEPIPPEWDAYADGVAADAIVKGAVDLERVLEDWARDGTLERPPEHCLHEALHVDHVETHNVPRYVD